MYRFGFKSFAQGASSLVENRTDVLIIGGMLGPAAVPLYSIPQALLTRIRGLVWTMSHALMPAFSELDAAGQRDRIHSMFHQASRLIVGVLTLFCVGSVSLGAPFIGLWVGDRYADEGAVILYLLTAYLFLGSVMPLGSRYLTAVGRHGILAKISAARALVNLGLSVGLAMPFGAPGVALGSLLATAFTIPLDWRAALRPMGTSLRTYFGFVLLPSVVPAAAFAAIAAAARYYGWTAAWPELLGTGLVCTLTFLALFAGLGLGAADRARLRRLLSGDRRG
jgi:O-antigen/teichoic acid export membrane protein